MLNLEAGVLTYPGQSNIYSPTVRHTRLGSFFGGLVITHNMAICNYTFEGYIIFCIEKMVSITYMNICFVSLGGKIRCVSSMLTVLFWYYVYASLEFSYMCASNWY